MAEDTAQPMADAPTEPTEAQREQQGKAGLPVPDEAAVDQARKDAEWRSDNPGKALIREANPEVAGEGFDYLESNRA